MNSAQTEPSRSPVEDAFTKARKRAQQQEDLAAIAQARREFRARVQRFSEENLPLAYEYASRWRCPHIPQEDLQQEAVLWMLDAVQRWEPGRGGTFATYAMWRMRHGLSEFVKKKFPIVHLPGNVRADQRVVRKAQRALQASLGRPPTDEELAAATPELSSIRREIALQHLDGLRFASFEQLSESYSKDCDEQEVG